MVLDCGIDEKAFDHAFSKWHEDERFVHIVADSSLEEAAARVSGMMQSKGEACAILDPRIIWHLRLYLNTYGVLTN